LIHRISSDQPGWGEDRIADELAIKLGVRHSTGTIRRYLVRRREPRGGQTWKTFVKNHASQRFALDFLTQHTAVFTIVYVLDGDRLPAHRAHQRHHQPRASLGEAADPTGDGVGQGASVPPARQRRDISSSVSAGGEKNDNSASEATCTSGWRTSWAARAIPQLGNTVTTANVERRPSRIQNPAGPRDASSSTCTKEHA